jgi:hypothetical protein
MSINAVNLKCYCKANSDTNDPLNWNEFLAAFPKTYAPVGEDGLVQEVAIYFRSPGERENIARSLFNGINGLGKNTGIDNDGSLITETEWEHYLSKYNHSSSSQYPTIYLKF